MLRRYSGEGATQQCRGGGAHSTDGLLDRILVRNAPVTWTGV